MKKMKELAAEADASAKNPTTGRPSWEIRADLRAAIAAEYPAVHAAMESALARQAGKKAVVAAAAAAALDLESPAVIEALLVIDGAQSWGRAWPALATLGFAGEIIARPLQRGVNLPCSPHACPGEWGTNWGLPNVNAVAQMILRRAPAQPTRGNGWQLMPA